jgi:hypothetical protein
MKPPRVIVAFLSGVFLAGALVWNAARRGDPERQATVVLQEIRELGELRTVRHTYRDVVRLDTSRRPADWAEPIPGATATVRLLTRNSAVVTWQAEIDAGVDLAKARVVQEANGPVIVLPRAQVYAPRIHTWVEWGRPGLFWRDENVAAAAQRKAAERAIRAALEAGILEGAERGALERVRKIAPGLDARLEG